MALPGAGHPGGRAFQWQWQLTAFGKSLVYIAGSKPAGLTPAQGEPRQACDEARPGFSKTGDRHSISLRPQIGAGHQTGQVPVSMPVHKLPGAGIAGLKPNHGIPPRVNRGRLATRPGRGFPKLVTDTPSPYAHKSVPVTKLDKCPFQCRSTSPQVRESPALSQTTGSRPG